MRNFMYQHTVSRRHPGRLAAAFMALMLLIVSVILSPLQVAAAPTLSATIDDSVTSGTNKFTYTGSWVNCGGCNPPSYHNGFKYSYTTSSTVTFTFSGTQAKLYGVKEAVGGIATASIDGGTNIDVDYYNSSQSLQNVFSTPVLADGTHTVKLTVSGRKNAASSSSTINIDKAEVYVGGSDTTPPSVSLTSPTNSQSVSVGTIVPISANASDNTSVANVKFYVNGVLKSTDVIAPYTYAWDTAGLGVGSYQITAVATDAAGNIATSSTATVTLTASTNPVLSATVDDSALTGANHFAYTGTWVNCSGCNPPSYNNGFRYSYTTGNTATLTFNGSQVKLYGVKEPVGGIATISIDGGATVDVDYYSSTQSLQNIYTSPILSNGSHTLVLTVSGRKNIASSSPTINIDKAEVYTGGSSNPTDTTVPTVVLNAPSNNSTYTVGDTVTLTAAASDNVGVSKVEFYVDGMLMSTDTSTPFSYDWETTGVTTGTHLLSAKAYDAAGNVATSTNVTVTLQALVGAGTWWSGQSDTSTTKDGSFAAWRGRDVEIAGNWASTASASDAISSAWWEVGAGDPNHSSYANIPRVDYAIGAMIDNADENWAAAASGAYDARWTQQLQQLKLAWGSRQASNMFIRFAHEFNGNWYPWKVQPSDVANFKAAWVRFANLRNQYFPGAQLVWCPNAGSSYNYDIRTLYPGNQYVDVISIDKYNNYPWVNDLTSFNTEINKTANGGPLGLETYRQYAQQQGKPFAVSEWSNDSNPAGDGNQGGGDSANYVQYFHDWLAANGSQTPQSGKVLYEILFNVTGYSDSNYSFFPLNAEAGNTAAATKYAELW